MPAPLRLPTARLLQLHEGWGPSLRRLPWHSTTRPLTAVATSSSAYWPLYAAACARKWGGEQSTVGDGLQNVVAACLHSRHGCCATSCVAGAAPPLGWGVPGGRCPGPGGRPGGGSSTTPPSLLPPQAPIAAGSGGCRLPGRRSSRKRAPALSYIDARGSGGRRGAHRRAIGAWHAAPGAMAAAGRPQGAARAGPRPHRLRRPLRPRGAPRASALPHNCHVPPRGSLPAP